MSLQKQQIWDTMILLKSYQCNITAQWIIYNKKSADNWMGFATRYNEIVHSHIPAIYIYIIGNGVYLQYQLENITLKLMKFGSLSFIAIIGYSAV